MKISLNWLKEFVEFDRSPEEIADILLFRGFETTVLSKPCNWTKVITAKVVEINKHPNADKLTLCTVADGTNTYSIVCGAPNVAKDQTIALAQLGAELPGGFKIEPRKIRGVESQGMICSQKELGIKEDTSGIMVLPPDTKIGIPLENALNDDNDTMLEVETTTSRPDCLNHLGIARELASYFKKNIKIHEPKINELPGDVKITVIDKDLCPRYIGYRISGVKVGPSPDRIKSRLEKCGIRPINNIVDITNYLMLEIGHPLHAFDLNLLEGKEIIVRRAGNGEKILALDGREYALDDTVLVICDAKKPQAIAGVMGGEHSGVTQKTTDILLESAVFYAASVRKTSKKLNISTDSSYRFERGCSWEMAELASKRAVELIQEIAGGKAEALKDDIAQPYVFNKVELRPERANKLLGTDISNNEMFEIFTNLNLKPVENGNKFITEIPSWRQDITQEADLIEEVARMYGYDKIPTTVLALNPDINEGERYKPAENSLRDRLVSLGFCEVMNNTFTSETQLKEYEMQPVESVANPISKENESLRTNLLPGLLANLKLNLSQGYKTIRIFETGNIFTKDGEKRVLGILAYGDILPEWWKFEDTKIISPKIDVTIIAGVMENILKGEGLVAVQGPGNIPAYFHPGKNSEISVNNAAAGHYGIIHPKFTMEFEKEIAYAELYLDDLKWDHKTSRYEPLKRFPEVKRDLALVAGSNIAFKDIKDDIMELVNNSEGLKAIFKHIDLFSRYELENNKISYSIHFKFQHQDHTLAENEINSAINLILETLKKNLNISLRT